MTPLEQSMQARRLEAIIRAADADAHYPSVDRRSVGERWVTSDSYRRLRDADWFKGGHPLPDYARSTQLLTGPEWADQLRTRTLADLAPFSVDGVPKVGAMAAPAMVPGLVDVIETGKDQVLLAVETTDTPGAAPVAVATALPEGAIAFPAAAALQQLPRFGQAWPVQRSMLDDPGVAQAWLDDRLALQFQVGLEAAILNGTGVFPQFNGITPTAGVGAVTKGSAGHTAEYDLDAIRRAVTLCQQAGWYVRPLSCVIDPAAYANMQGQKNSQGAYVWDPAVVASITEWIPSRQMAAGTALVGDFRSGYVTFVKTGKDAGLTVELASSHLDQFVTGTIELKLEARCWGWTRRPDAFVLVSALTV